MQVTFLRAIIDLSGRDCTPDRELVILTKFPSFFTRRKNESRAVSSAFQKREQSNRTPNEPRGIGRCHMRGRAGFTAKVNTEDGLDHNS
jgi:hypothetical protein